MRTPSESSAARPGIITDPRRVVANRWLNAISILVPLTGSLAVPVLWPQTRPGVVTILLFAAFFLLTAVGIGVGLHRLFTHRAFEATPLLRRVLAVLGTWAMQGPLDRWVADHRRHHRFTDEPLDPHSPYWFRQKRIGSRVFGLMHAHFLWMVTGDVTDKGYYAADIGRDPVTDWCSRHYWSLAASSLLLPSLLGGLVGGWEEGLRGLLWAGCVRVALLHQITWSVNSIGHMFGSKVEGSRDESRDSAWLALLLLGEGLHSYHHRYPAAAVNKPLYLDFNGLVILGLEKLGAVENPKRY